MAQPVQNATTVRPVYLRFEHHREALGIGEPLPRISWKFQGSAPDWKQSGYELEITRPTNPDILESHRVDSDQSVLVPWPSSPLVSGESASVRIRAHTEQGTPTPWSESATVEAGLLHPEDWTCSLIQSSRRQEPDLPHEPLLFRRQFHVPSAVDRARLYITAHGVYEAEINGERVGDHVLAPGWTSYHHELPYQTFDVTEHLKVGINVLGAHVGEGWFSGRLGFLGGTRNIWGDSLGVIAQLVITYKDGSSETVATDDKWKCSIGAVVRSEIYDGESYDDRRYPAGWSIARGHTKVFTG